MVGLDSGLVALSADWSLFNEHHPIWAQVEALQLIGEKTHALIMDPEVSEAYRIFAQAACEQMSLQAWKHPPSDGLRKTIDAARDYAAAMKKALEAVSPTPADATERLHTEQPVEDPSAVGTSGEPIIAILPGGGEDSGQAEPMELEPGLPPELVEVGRTRKNYRAELLDFIQQVNASPQRETVEMSLGSDQHRPYGSSNALNYMWLNMQESGTDDHNFMRVSELEEKACMPPKGEWEFQLPRGYLLDSNDVDRQLYELAGIDRDCESVDAQFIHCTLGFNAQNQHIEKAFRSWAQHDVAGQPVVEEMGDDEPWADGMDSIESWVDEYSDMRSYSDDQLKAMLESEDPERARAGQWELIRREDLRVDFSSAFASMSEKIEQYTQEEFFAAILRLGQMEDEGKLYTAEAICLAHKFGLLDFLIIGLCSGVRVTDLLNSLFNSAYFFMALELLEKLGFGDLSLEIFFRKRTGDDLTLLARNIRACQLLVYAMIAMGHNLNALKQHLSELVLEFVRRMVGVDSSIAFKQRAAANLYCPPVQKSQLYSTETTINNLYTGAQEVWLRGGSIGGMLMIQKMIERRCAKRATKLQRAATRGLVADAGAPKQKARLYDIIHYDHVAADATIGGFGYSFPMLDSTVWQRRARQIEVPYPRPREHPMHSWVNMRKFGAEDLGRVCRDRVTAAGLSEMLDISRYIADMVKVVSTKAVDTIERAWRDRETRLREHRAQYSAYAHQKHEDMQVKQSLLGNLHSKYELSVVRVDNTEAAYDWSPIELMQHYEEWKLVAQSDNAQHGGKGGYDERWNWHYDTRDFTEVLPEMKPRGSIYLYPRKHAFNHFIYLDCAVKGVCSERTVVLIKGLIANGFLTDWKEHRFVAGAITNNCLRCLSTGQDFLQNSPGRLVMEVLRKVVSINPMLNIYTIARASKEELEEAMVLMLAMSESEELKSHSYSVTVERLLKAFVILQELRIDQSINWLVSSGVAVILYEMLVCDTLISFIDVDLTEEGWKQRVAASSQSLSRAVCLEVATTAILTTFTLA
jgi:hypothetical protein